MSELNKTSNSGVWVYLLLGLLLLSGISYWIYSTIFTEEKSETVVSLDVEVPQAAQPIQSDLEPVVAEVVEPTEPDIPEKQTPEVTESQEEVVELPDLDGSDTVVREQLTRVNESTDFLLWLQSPQLIQRWITVIDGLSKGNLIRGIVSVETPKEKFPVIKNGKRYFLDTKGYERFNHYVQLIESVPAEELANVFHFFRPLLEEAYGLLGNKPENLDNTVIKALDNILKAPIFPGDIELVAKTVSYQFADEEIESLSQLDKLMIRMGPENTAALQKYAREVKTQLLSL
ncbi:DUF3014 domain-containing protein [Sessilibacter corallicola]|uniref:DUF3014 domain-containing protein n=1 Tax=Sessilibacter corallicola TaxID=2904075 RepID=A0ABQ0A7W9_9GAMM